MGRQAFVASATSGSLPLDIESHRVHASHMKRTPQHSADDSELVARDVRPDAKTRVTLGKALADLGDDVHFNIYRNATGQIILDPQVSIPAAEAWLYRNPKAIEAVRRGLDEVGRNKAKTIGSFAKYADEE